MSLLGISTGFPVLSPSLGQVSYVLRTRAPLSNQPKSAFPFDLHVLGTPPTFILSQDQTRRRIVIFASIFSVRGQLFLGPLLAFRLHYPVVKLLPPLSLGFV